jgi:DNA-binding CsgD family transcriptional regulator/sugar-specific transcriptional regulator TrmB
MDLGIPTAHGGHLTAPAIRLYGQIARGEKVREEQKPELEELVAWGLVTYDEQQPDIPVAVEPREAMRRYGVAQLGQIMAQMKQVSAIPAVADELSVQFERAAWQSGAGSQFLGEQEIVNARIQDVVAKAEGEILAAQPGGPRTRELMDIAVRRDSEALKRGVRLQTLYRDTVRDDEVTQDWARTMTAAGASYRTLMSPFERFIIVDRRHAFISDYVVPGAPEHAAWHVTDRAVVGYMAKVFENNWHRAQPWRGEPRERDVAGPAGVVRTTPLQREILRDTVAGKPQKATAARLGFSLRTLTRHIDEMRKLWGAESLPQLAALWMVSPDRLVDDRPGGEPMVGESAA